MVQNTFLHHSQNTCTCIHKHCFNSVMADSDPRDFSPPGFCDHGISQTRILEWVAISFYKGSSSPRIEPVSPALQVDSLPLNDQGRPWEIRYLHLLCIFLLKKIFFNVDYFWSLYWFFLQYYLFFVFWPQSLWDLSFLTRDWICAPALKGEFLSTGPPGKPLHLKPLHLLS